MRYTMPYFIANSTMCTFIYLSTLVPRLITTYFLDQLWRHAPVGITALTAFAMLFELVLARTIAIVAGCITDTHLPYQMSMMLSRNLLAHILRTPGNERCSGLTGGGHQSL